MLNPIYVPWLCTRDIDTTMILHRSRISAWTQLALVKTGLDVIGAELNCSRIHYKSIFFFINTPGYISR